MATSRSWACPSRVTTGRSPGPRQDALASRAAEARCGLQVIDLRTADVVHWLRLEGRVSELYDVVPMPGVRRPVALGFKTDAIRRVIGIEE